MEVRPPSFKARLFDSLGLGARIPKPSGPYLVRSCHFRVPGEHGVLVQAFFPVARAIVRATTTYHEEKVVINQQESQLTVIKRAYRKGVLRGFSYFSSTPSFLFDLFLGASPHPLADVPKQARPMIKDAPRTMPLVLFSHGLGGNCEVYTKTCSDLASHGYIVIALEHEDGSGSFARTISNEVVKYKKPPSHMNYTRDEVINFRAPFLKKRESEIRQAVEFITTLKEGGRIANVDNDLYRVLLSVDPEQIILAGHSFGGASTVHTVRAWPGRFRGCILMDLWPFPIPDLESGLDTPLCSILSEPFAKGSESFLTWTLLKNSKHVIFNLYMPDSVHSSFSDTPWWAPGWLSKRFSLRGGLDPDVVQKSFNHVYVEFIKHVLGNGDSSTNLQELVLSENPLLRAFTKDDANEKTNDGVNVH